MVALTRAAPTENAEIAGLYARTRPTLFRALVGLYGTYEGVEDAIQEAWVIFLEQRDHRPDRLEAWLFGVARNRLRRRWRAGVLLRRIGFHGASITPSLDDELRRIDLVGQLQQLSERDREIVVAKYYLGLTQEEIAEALHVNRGTISSSISRAVAKLRAMEDGHA